MRVFIAGASGAVGRALIPSLIKQGHTPISMIRSSAHESRLRDLGAQTVVADGLDRDAVTKAVTESQPEVVVHVMTALKNVQDYKNFDHSFADTNLLRTAGTDNLLHAARISGVRHIVAHSFAGWNYAKDGRAEKLETDALDVNPPTNQRQSLAALIHLERAVLENTYGITGTVLRCGNLYGPGTAIAPEGSLVKLIQKRQMPIIGTGSGIWSFLDVNDAASATVDAITRNATGIFNIADDEPAQVSAWVTELASVLKAPKPMHIPTFLGKLVAGEVGVSMMTLVRGASNAKARKTLDWRPSYSTWREGFRVALASKDAGVPSLLNANY